MLDLGGDDYATAVAVVEEGAVATGLSTGADGVETWARRIDAGGALGWSRAYAWNSVAIDPLGPGSAGLGDRAVIAYRRAVNMTIHEALITLSAAGDEVTTEVLTDDSGVMLGAAGAPDGGFATVSQHFTEGFLVRRFAPDGSMLWASSACTGGNGRGVAFAPDGAVAAIGFEDGGGGADAKLCKLSPDGALLWARLLDSGSGDDYGHAVAVLADGTVVAGGVLDRAGGGSRGFIAAYPP